MQGHQYGGMMRLEKGAVIMQMLTCCGTFLGLTMLLPGCATTDHDNHHGHDRDREMHAHIHTANRAIANLAPTAGNTAHGVVRFEQIGSAMRVIADVHGLNANATHAWHIHEFGDVSSSDGTATGGHYNPEGHAHGLPTTSARHAGDLGNLMTDASGSAHAEITVHNVTINGERNPIVGRAIIVHAKADDGGQPTGNAGPRIAQGVIGVTK